MPVYRHETLAFGKLNSLWAQLELGGLTALVVVVILLAARWGMRKPENQREPIWHYVLAVFGLFLSYSAGLVIPLII